MTKTWPIFLSIVALFFVSCQDAQNRDIAFRKAASIYGQSPCGNVAEPHLNGLCGDSSSPPAPSPSPSPQPERYDLYVSSSGSDTAGDGSRSYPYYTIEKAYDQIHEAGLHAYNIILLQGTGAYIPISLSGTLTWTKSGSEAYPIRIFSEDEMVTIGRREDQGGSTSVDYRTYLLYLTDVSFIQIYRIHFDNAHLGLRLENADYCEVVGNKFTGDLQAQVAPGAGAIWIGAFSTSPDGGTAWETHFLCYIGQTPGCDPSTEKSEFNIVSQNYMSFDNSHIASARDQLHGIYISNGAWGNEIIFNSIYSPSGSGIQFNHGLQEQNHVARNFIYVNELATFPRFDLNLTWQYIKVNPNYECAQFNYFRDNSIHDNYLYADSNESSILNDESCYGSNLIGGNPETWAFRVIDSGCPYGGPINLCDTNSIDRHYVYYKDQDDGRAAHDPFWLGYDIDKYTGRVVSGDFDHDGHEDDIATFYAYAGGSTRIDVFTGEYDSVGHQNYAFEFKDSPPWWINSSYTANNFTGRVVAGDFDRDGRNDDLATFYDYGDNETRLHVFKSTGSSFQYSGATGWWTGSNFDADRINGRVVSGDFNNNGPVNSGRRDDIAALYAYTGTETHIVVFTSSGVSFSTTGLAGWWGEDGYSAGNVTDRVVSGDFDHDGYLDDIAVFRQYANGEARIHVFLSNGSSFQYSGSQGWWSAESGYTPNNFTGRMISGDFDHDGYLDDIAVLYSYTGGETRIHVFTSTGSGFNYSGSQGWWSATGYTAGNTTGRVVSGDFFRTGRIGDIVTFYDYEDANGPKSRTHAWKSGGTYFSYAGSLGFPWIKGVEF